ncbi:MAG: methyltransferase [Eubacteriales bacterium]|nr:methyltransferase [Eubacteriales bacterium]
MNEYTLRNFLEEHINENLLQMILSGNKSGGEPSRVKIRPVLLKDRLLYQASQTMGAKVLHTNYERGQVITYIEDMMQKYFRQLQSQGMDMDGSVLVSKRGKMTFKSRKHSILEQARELSHNRTKKYILKEGTPVPFLIDLGVMTKEGRIVSRRYDKFRQINRFLEFIEDILPKLPRDREVTILDFGCGKSYLTFAMYYYLKLLKGYDVNIIGLDLKTDVIERCNALARSYGYEKLRFYQGDIAQYEGVREVDMVVTLHACDTATDYALNKAVRWGAQVILSVPCCQHEVNAQISSDLLSPVFSYGILQERMAALITDGIRAKLLERHGYETQILEFIDMEHTPKNLLIRAVRTEKRTENPELDRMMEELHIKPSLKRLLEEESDAV